MANYDDIFNASQSVETDEKSYSSFDKEEWAAQKKQEREDAFALIDSWEQLGASRAGQSPRPELGHKITVQTQPALIGQSPDTSLGSLLTEVG